jgi:N-acetylneuraminate synthase
MPPESTNVRRFCFDIDGVLCTNTWGEYESAEPLRDAIAQVNQLHAAGHRIILATARGSQTGIDWRDLTEQQLARWGVAYHELWMNKPAADVYIDDRAVNSSGWLRERQIRERTNGRAVSGSDVIVSAEIGCNHMGDVEVALEMIEVAARFCKVDVAKFQKRTPRELLTPEQFVAPHPNPMHSFGTTYGEHREYLELTIDQHAVLKERCEELGLGYLTSVWDPTAAREAMALEPFALKVPSSKNDDWELLGLLAENFSGQLHVSLGMVTREEENEIVAFLDQAGRLNDTVLYACTSGYPIANVDACLLEIGRLKAKYGDRVLSIGYSGHHNGIALDVAAITLGARWLERHFTLDRTLRGTDHAASLEPDGLRRVKRDAQALLEALRSKPSEGILEVEMAQRLKLKGHGTKSPGEAL